MRSFSRASLCVLYPRAFLGVAAARLAFPADGRPCSPLIGVKQRDEIRRGHGENYRL